MALRVAPNAGEPQVTGSSALHQAMTCARVTVRRSAGARSPVNLTNSSTSPEVSIVARLVIRQPRIESLLENRSGPTSEVPRFCIDLDLFTFFYERGNTDLNASFEYSHLVRVAAC
jgi:hypothetical protein